MPPAARVGDMHVCSMQTPGSHRFRMWAGRYFPPGCPHVLIGNMPAACMGDSAVCVGPPDVIIKGSSSVLIGGRPRRPHGRSDGPRRADRHGLSYSHNRRVDYLLAGKWMAAPQGL